MKYCVLDLETTGLDLGVDQITEAAFIVDGVEHQFFVQHDRLPSKWVLDKTDYVQRILGADKVPVQAVLYRLQEVCDDETYLVGANPAFDHGFLRHEFDKRNWIVPYRFRLIDIEALVMGAHGLAKPPSLKECREILGLPGQNDAPHTALSDAREVKVLFEALQAQFGALAA